MSGWKQQFHYEDEGWTFLELIIEPAADGLSQRVGICPSCLSLVSTGSIGVSRGLEAHIESLHRGRTQPTEGRTP